MPGAHRLSLWHYLQMSFHLPCYQDTQLKSTTYLSLRAFYHALEAFQIDILKRITWWLAELYCTEFSLFLWRHCFVNWKYLRRPLILQTCLNLGEILPSLCPNFWAVTGGWIWFFVFLGAWPIVGPQIIFASSFLCSFPLDAFFFPLSGRYEEIFTEQNCI